MFEQGIKPVRVARSLRVSTKSAYQWRRRWRAGGPAALASKGPGESACRLDEVQLARLRAALDLDPAAYGWKQYQRWTLARVTALIARSFHVRYVWVTTSGQAWADSGVFMPERWEKDWRRRGAAGIPGSLRHKTKPQLAREQLERLLDVPVPSGGSPSMRSIPAAAGSARHARNAACHTSGSPPATSGSPCPPGR
jgi:transposase